MDATRNHLSEEKGERARSMINETEFLSMALVGYQHRLAEIEQTMMELRAQIAERAKAPGLRVVLPGNPPRPRRMSAEARKRIADAQRKRWDAHRRARAATQQHKTA